ncbi:TPA: hypothetical protein L9R60_005484 [Klebsiella pneumoniae]|nr:hypothetical protein [Klebsiella pneumoniae]
MEKNKVEFLNFKGKSTPENSIGLLDLLPPPKNDKIKPSKEITLSFNFEERLAMDLILILFLNPTLHRNSASLRLDTGAFIAYP